MIVPNRPPSGFFVACLKELPDIPFLRNQNSESVFRLALERFSDVRRLVETFCDLCSAVAAALEVDLTDAGRVTLSSDLTAVTANRRIGGKLLAVSIAHSKIDWALEGCDAIVEILRVLTVRAESLKAFVSAAIHLVLVFLPIDQRLLADVLGLLVRFAEEGGGGLIVPAMESALIELSGRPSICFPRQCPFTAEFPSPYSPTGQIIVRSMGRVEKVRGIERLKDFLKGL
jgi:hypothetical protein